MFEEGARLRREHGADAVFDFSLGNPDLPPPEGLLARLRELTQGPPDEIHRYMANCGWPQVREKIADSMTERTGIDYGAGNIIMTVGAGGGLNVLFKALLDPGDEVIVLRPYFVEYLFYVGNHQGKTVEIETDARFGLSAENLSAAITPRTRAVVINSPNNPTGRVYTRDELTEFAEALRDGARKVGHPIYLITDEPYRKILYDGVECPEIPPLYDDTLLVTSHSKDLGLAGERIGYIAISPRAADADEVMAAATFCNRTLGFVNAPSLFQLAVAECQHLAIDTTPYDERRKLLLEHLGSLGFEIVPPGGAFYLFPRSPIEDDARFATKLLDERILVVPGRGFGRPGHFRISFAVPTETIERSLPAWERIAAQYRGATKPLEEAK